MAVIPIFVSSTFRDFHAERDAIRSLVAPALSAAVAPYACRVEVLDLRWGIETASLGDQALAQQRVLDVCLSEVDRCRPLFVGLLGDRFGWVPPPKRLAEAAFRSGVDLASVPSPPGGQSLSVTALEVLHGSRRGSNPVIVIRRLTGEVPPEWRDSDRQEACRWLRNVVLQGRSGETSEPIVLEYAAQVRDRRVERADVEGLSEGLVDALTPLVVRRAQEFTSQFVSPYEAAASSLEDSRQQVLVGRDELIETTRGLMVGRQPQSLVLHGDSGRGKTSVFVDLCGRLAGDARVAKVYVGLGPQATSSDDLVRRLAPQLGLSPDPSSSGTDLQGWWKNELTKLASPTILAIDGLDRLAAGEEREDLPLLRVPLGATQVQVLATTTLSDQVTTLRSRGFHGVEVGLLEVTAVAAAAKTWAAAGGRRELPTRVVELLAVAPRSPQWVALAVDSLGWLDQTDYERAEARTGDAAGALEQLLLEQARRLAPEDKVLSREMLTRALELFDQENQGEAFLASLAVTRSGLSLGDLHQITGASQLDVARARWLLGRHLTERDSAGRLAFDHDLVRQAVSDVLDPQAQVRTHQLIADHLASSVSSMSPTAHLDRTVVLDLVWHAGWAGDSRSLGAALSGYARDDEEGRNQLADTAGDLIRACRDQDARLWESLEGLSSAVPLADHIHLVEVLTRLLDRQGLGRLHIDECERLVRVLLGLLTTLKGSDLVQDKWAASAALVTAGEVLSDALDPRPDAVSLLHDAQRALESFGALSRTSRDWVILAIRVNLALASRTADESRRADFTGVVLDVAREVAEGPGARTSSHPPPHGDWAPEHGAISSARTAVALARELVQLDADDHLARQYLLRALNMIGRSAYSGVLPVLEEAGSLSRDVVRTDPGPENLALRVESLLALAEGYGIVQRDWNDVWRLLEEASSLSAQLTNSFPTNARFRALNLRSADRLDAVFAKHEAQLRHHQAVQQRPAPLAPAYIAAMRAAEADPRRQSAVRSLLTIGWRYHDELESCGFYWRAAAVQFQARRWHRAMGSGRRSSSFPVQAVAGLVRRYVHWPSVVAVYNRLSHVLGLALAYPAEAYVEAIDNGTRWIYRDRRSGHAVAETEHGCSPPWTGVASLRSVRRAVLAQALLQMLGVVAILGLVGLVLVRLVDNREWGIAVPLAALVLWHQFSRRSAEWWDHSPIPGRPTAEAERRARLLLSVVPGNASAAEIQELTGEPLSARTTVLWERAVESTQVNTLGFSSRDASVVGLQYDGHLQMFDDANGLRVPSPRAIGQRTQAMAISSRTGLLAVGCDDGRARLLTPSSELIATAKGHKGQVLDVSFSPDERILATAGSDGAVHLWSAGTGAHMVELAGHEGAVSGCSFHPDGERIATSGWDGTVRVWNLRSRRTTHALAAPRAASYRHRAFGCQLSPDGQLLLGVGAKGQVRIWQLESGQIVATRRTETGRGQAFSADSRLVAMSGAKEGLSIWDPFRDIEVAHQRLPEAVVAVAWHPRRPVVYCSAGMSVIAIEIRCG